jgi:hypothetical protein
MRPERRPARFRNDPGSRGRKYERAPADCEAIPQARRVYRRAQQARLPRPVPCRPPSGPRSQMCGRGVTRGATALHRRKWAISWRLRLEGRHSSSTPLAQDTRDHCAGRDSSHFGTCRIRADRCASSVVRDTSRATRKSSAFPVNFKCFFQPIGFCCAKRSDPPSKRARESRKSGHDCRCEVVPFIVEFEVAVPRLTPTNW